MAQSSTSSNAPTTPRHERIGFCRLCLNALKWLPVVLITVIVGWSYYAYVVQLCFYLVPSTLEFVLYLFFYHIFLFMFLWAYMKTVFCNIGEIPNQFRVTPSVMEKLIRSETDEQQRRILEEFSRNLPIVNTTEMGCIRYCDKCHHVKPDRAHHCSVCGRCVLKMDHHCPWVNNCVSFYNYKFFILFLGYSLFYCLFIGLTSLRYFILFWRGQLMETFGRFHILFLFFVALMFAISLVSLFGYHCCLVYNNRTTLEAFRAPYFRSGEDKNGFNVGRLQNFHQVFGPDARLWFLPIYSSLGQGIIFPVQPQHRTTSHYNSMGTTQNRSSDDEEESTPKHTIASKKPLNQTTEP